MDMNRAFVKTKLKACTQRLLQILRGAACTDEDYELVLETRSLLEEFNYVTSKKPAFMKLIKHIHAHHAKKCAELEIAGTQRLRAALAAKKV
jgi:hypothetical protein